MSGQPLTPAELAELERLEGIITRGWRVFVEVGDALTRIHEQRLYRQTHDSFEAYCKDVWKWSRPRAYQLMDAARTSHVLAEVGVTVETEREARRLKPVAALVAATPPDQRHQVAMPSPEPRLPTVLPPQDEKPDASMVLSRKGGHWSGWLYAQGRPGERIPPYDCFEDAAAHVARRLTEMAAPELVPA